MLLCRETFVLSLFRFWSKHGTEKALSSLGGDGDKGQHRVILRTELLLDPQPSAPGHACSHMRAPVDICLCKSVSRDLTAVSECVTVSQELNEDISVCSHSLPMYVHVPF